MVGAFLTTKPSTSFEKSGVIANFLTYMLVLLYHGNLGSSLMTCSEALDLFSMNYDVDIGQEGEVALALPT